MTNVAIILLVDINLRNIDLYTSKNVLFAVCKLMKLKCNLFYFNLDFRFWKIFLHSSTKNT